MDRVFAYEHGSPYRVTDNTRVKLMDEVDGEEFSDRRLPSRIVFNDLDRLCTLLSKTALEQAVVLQLDPSFQPQFELYTGLVFQLVCNGRSAPVVLARGGRYDELVQRCGAPQNQAFGAGFSLAIDPIRELLVDNDAAKANAMQVMVAYSSNSNLENALDHQRQWHASGRAAVIELQPIESIDAARSLAQARGDFQLDWVDL